MKNTVYFVSESGESENIDYLPEIGAQVSIDDTTGFGEDYYEVKSHISNESEMVVVVDRLYHPEVCTHGEHEEVLPFKGGMFDYRNQLYQEAISEFSAALFKEVQQLKEPDRESKYLDVDDIWKDNFRLFDYFVTSGMMERVLERLEKRLKDYYE